VQYSYTQVAKYLTCPLHYRYQYLDGWKDKDRRAAAQFGRIFEASLRAGLMGDDALALFRSRWSEARDLRLDYGRRDTWSAMLEQGISLLELFRQQTRIHISDPQRDLQVCYRKQLDGKRQFLGVLDGIGVVDGTKAIIEWKTSSMRSPDQPPGIVGLDPQLVCYAWLSGIPRACLVTFVRKRQPEIQIIRVEIPVARCRAWEVLVGEVATSIEAGIFPAHTGIRFPQNPCTTCPHLGLCLGSPQLVHIRLQPRDTQDDWLDQLAF
jgi:hypothetical protein